MTPESIWPGIFQTGGGCGYEKTMIIVWLVALVLVPFHLAKAQQPGKIYRIGILTPDSASRASRRNEATLIDSFSEPKMDSNFRR